MIVMLLNRDINFVQYEFQELLLSPSTGINYDMLIWNTERAILGIRLFCSSVWRKYLIFFL